MQTRQYLSLFSGFLATILIASPVLAKNDLPLVNEDGMELVKDTRMTTIYADPDVDLRVYKKIILADASVAFKKNWKRDQNRNSSYAAAFWVKDSDVERIKKDTSTLFKEVFTKELEANGYVLVDAPGEDVLLVVPEIVDLDVVAPDLRNASRGQSYSESAGEMTLELELFDSLTNDLIVKARDRQRDFRDGYYEWRNSVSNRSAAQRMMKVWAKSFRQALDEARVTVIAANL